MKLEIKTEFRELYGGDGVTRTLKMEKKSMGRTKQRRTMKPEVGLERSSDISETQTEIKDEPVNTFKMVDGIPTQRFGGVHGKMWGAMRAAGKLLAELNDEDFKSIASVERMMQMINMYPVYPQFVMPEGTEMTLETIPQIMAGFRKTMVIQHFDNIPLCNIDMVVEFPDHIERHVKKMLKHMQTMALMNKRRASMKILDMKEG